MGYRLKFARFLRSLIDLGGLLGLFVLQLKALEQCTELENVLETPIAMMMIQVTPGFAKGLIV
jgi:hypothetical protein